MLPTLLSIGPFTVYTLNIFLILAFLTGGFVFWRFGREEHYREDELFDGFLLSFFIGMVVSRAVHITLNFSEYGWNLFSWFNVWSDAGFHLFAGLIASALALYRFAGKQKWEQFAVLDLWMPAVMFGTAILQIGLFFSEPLKTLFNTGLWFMSTQLFLSVIFFVLAFYSRWVEFHYRTYMWYKHNHQVAQTGFVTAMSTLFLGLAVLFSDYFNYGWVFFVSYLSGVLLVVVGIGLLLVRSGVFAFHHHSKLSTFHNSSANSSK